MILKRLERPERLERRKRSLGHIFDSNLTLVSPVSLVPPIPIVALVPLVSLVPLRPLLHIATYRLFVVRSREMWCIAKETAQAVGSISCQKGLDVAST